MDKESSEKFAKNLANILENQLAIFLQKNPIEMLETIKKKLIFNDTALRPVINDLIEDLEEYDKKFVYHSHLDMPEKWQFLEESIHSNLKSFHNAFFQNFLYFSVLQILLSSPYSALNEKYKENLRSKYNLTPKKLQEALTETLKDLFIEKVKHGGSKSEFDERKKLQFLGYYNRYLIVIKNARKEKKILQRKQKKSELAAKREALAKYEIPERLIDSAFSSDAASDVALDWAMETLEISFTREYSKTLLNKIGNRRRGNRLIVDADYSIGRRIYAFNNRDNKQKAELLRYTPPSQTHYEDWNDPRSFLVEMGM